MIVILTKTLWIKGQCIEIYKGVWGRRGRVKRGRKLKRPECMKYMMQSGVNEEE